MSDTPKTQLELLQCNTLINAEEFWVMLRISKQSFYRWKKQRKDFPCEVNFGRTVRWRICDAIDFVQKNTAPSNGAQ